MIDKPLSITVYDNEYKKEESYKNLCLDEQYLLDKKNQKTYYYHRDHQGSIIALSNDSKEIIERFIYDESYGKIVKHEKLIETYNPYCYTGREFDCDDLYYYRARYYDPTLRMFLSKDPIEFLSGDYNFYRYVGNDPVNFNDPLGFSKCDEKSKKDKVNSKSRKLKDGLQGYGKKVAIRSSIKGIVSSFLAFIDGLFPIGDAVASAIMAHDANTIIDEIKEFKNQISELREDINDFLNCKEENQAGSKKDDGIKVQKSQEQKCKALNGQKQSPNPNEFHGGRHGTLQPGGKLYGKESHHMPPKSAYSTGGNHDDKPAIQMRRSDHEKTFSWGRSNTAQVYQGLQKYLVEKNLNIVATALDIVDIQMLDNARDYDEAIVEMLAYAACMKFI